MHNYNLNGMNQFGNGSYKLSKQLLFYIWNKLTNILCFKNEGKEEDLNNA